MPCRLGRGRSGVTGWERTLVACYEDSRDVDERNSGNSGGGGDDNGNGHRNGEGMESRRRDQGGTQATARQRCGKTYKQPLRPSLSGHRARGKARCMRQQRPALRKAIAGAWGCRAPTSTCRAPSIAHQILTWDYPTCNRRTASSHLSRGEEEDRDVAVHTGPPRLHAGPGILHIHDWCRFQR